MHRRSTLTEDVSTPESPSSGSEMSSADSSPQPLQRRQRTRNRIFPHTPKHRESSLTMPNGVSFHGLFNLVVLLLITAAIQLMVKNFYQYGFLLDLTFVMCVWGDIGGFLVVCTGIYIHSLSGWIVIKAQVRQVISYRLGMVIYTIAQTILYIVPIRVVFVRQIAPLMAGLVVLILVVNSLKMHSYFATNTILLKHLQKGKKVEETFPGNVTLHDYIYFMVAPTLVYETYYPRNEKVRYSKVIRDFAACGISLLTAQFVCAQFILPVLADLEGSQGVTYDVIRLSIPSITAWLLGFYAFFHCWLNAIGELIRFGDREFYLDWWNATSLDVFWKKWNILVHEWLLRHVYLESMRTAKTSQTVATIMTFLFSAIYHELIFFVAFRVLRPWFFLGMFMQIPMIIVSKQIYNSLGENHRDFWGNVNVWLGFFVGQPLIEILYIREWFLSNPSLFCVPKSSVFGWFW